MTRRFASAALTLLLVGVMSSCILDPKPKPPTPDPPPVTDKFEDLSQKWHVLNNLKLAYNERDIVHYTEVLDSLDFIFFFSDGDVGGNIPAQWGYDEEISSATNMFNKGGSNPILSIDLDVVNFKKAQWEEFNTIDFPGWFRTTVSYNFNITTEQDVTFVTSGTPRAEFTIRKSNNGQWKLVRWRDIANG